jgi:guanylate kinase
LISRGQDTTETIANRLKRSWDEISHWDAYDYVLVNDDIDETEEKLRTIILSERMRRSQQPSLVEHVRALKAEFEEGE